MEGEVARRRGFIVPFILAVLVCAWILSTVAIAQDSPQPDGTQLNLRKSVQTREYQGREVEGEERVVGRGDSLWRILVQEKGVPEKRFRSYLVVIRGLNPQLKSLDVLRVGDNIFIPLRPDDALGASSGSAKNSLSSESGIGQGTTIPYRVKSGEHLYQILREQLKIQDERQLAMYYALVKDLNPERKDWDVLQEGAVIRLPTTGQTQAITTADTRPTVPVTPSSTPEVSLTQKSESIINRPDLSDARRLTARENIAILAKVVEAIGGQVQRSGEEVVPMKEDTVRFDRSNFPVVYNPNFMQRVVLDPNDKIPASIRMKLRDPSVATPVVSMNERDSLQDAVSRLLTDLGYQPLPPDRPVILQDEGVAFEARGSWIALAPEESNKPQQIFVVNLTESPNEIPAYLKSQLALKGLYLTDVVLPSEGLKPMAAVDPEPKESLTPIETWPRDKKEMVDSLLLAYGIPFGVAETVSVELRDGLTVDTRIDRVFEVGGQQIALFFQRAEPEIKKALQEKRGMKTVEIEVASLSSREVIGELLNVLGDKADYTEHRFSAAKGARADRLIISAWGFLPSKQPMFITDRDIPPSLQRFFFEKGLEIVYFNS